MQSYRQIAVLKTSAYYVQGGRCHFKYAIMRTPMEHLQLTSSHSPLILSADVLRIDSYLGNCEALSKAILGR